MPGPAPMSAAPLHPSPSLSRRARRSVGPDRRGDGDGRAQGGAGGAPGSTRGGGAQICCKGAPRRDRRRGPRRLRPASSPSRCAFCTRDVRFALENDGWNCTFECEVHLSAPEAPAVVAVRPAAALPWVRGGAGCPNLLQRPRSRRSVGRETLIFRASSRRQSWPGAPLQQFWTRPRPESTQDPRTPHSAPARVIMTTPAYAPAAPQCCP